MTGLLRVYVTLDLAHWELEVADPDRDHKLTRISKGQFHVGDMTSEDVTRRALQQAWKQSGSYYDPKPF